jgi:aspartyl-tRNA(Asn)/glutamyl-tRNA(Gln) amidotransferase subunit C
VLAAILHINMAGTLSRGDVIKLADLARLELSEEEIERYIKELSAILEYVEQLKDVAVDGLKPTNQVSGLKNVWREDKIIDYGYKPEELLKNVPTVQVGYLKVKRMVG